MQYHFIGIGGYGMSGIAKVLLEMGEKVSGSDVNPSERTERLASLGATIYKSHAAENLDGAEVVIFSTDVPADNAELAAARNQGIHIRHRSEVLAEIMGRNYGIAVTGTHGKTTVTSMIALVLERGGLDPTALIGADVPFYNGNAKLGEGNILVAEADESDGSFLRYHPNIGVITNVEPEHLDHYQGEFDQLLTAMRRFLLNIRSGGVAVLSNDDSHVREIARETGVPSIMFGLGPGAEISARDINAGPLENSFTLIRNGEPLGRVSLQIPGIHNISNALAAVAVGLHLEIPFTGIEEALADFRGAKRRFQVVGQWEGITVVDDYAHHPTEIRATLRAARDRNPKRLIAVFQPQRYSRTHMLLKEFGEAFGEADEVVLADIYSPAGEKPIPGVSSQVLADLIREQEGGRVTHIVRAEEIVDYLLRTVRAGDIVITMGAGDIWKVARNLVDRMKGIKAS